MQFPRRRLNSDRSFLFFLFLLGFLFAFIRSSFVYALGENQPIHFSGDRQIWDRKGNRVELFGHGAVNQQGETLTADYIRLDLNARTLDAKGNCIYILPDTQIVGEEMHFNLDTRTGTVIAGRISTDTFTLRGERINKLGEGRYQVHGADYTTCQDCSASWSFQAEDVDMEIDGYGYFKNVVTRVKEAPAFWLPYMIVPMKTHRQTGFIFPKIGASGANGGVFTPRFFWAIDRSVDMTFGIGQYTGRGFRFETEGRYVLSGQSSATANFYYITDRTFYQDRWAINLEQRHELPWHIVEKLRLTELSDNLYPFYFGEDILRAAGEAVLTSSLSFSRSSSDVSAFVAFQRNRNLVNSTPGDTQAQSIQFDPRTVQALPTVAVTTNDKFLFNTPALDTPVFGGISLGFTHFTRSAGAFDYDPASGVPFGTVAPSGLAPDPGIDPIRKAVRFSINPSLYTTGRLFDVISLSPSIQYRGYAYSFSNNMPALYRGYPLLQMDLSTQLEKVYNFPNEREFTKAKHLIRPVLTYSFIPPDLKNEALSHPFVRQIRQPGKPSFTPGYNFDDYDIIPYSYQPSSSNYFIPLGNSLTYGLSTQWIRKRELGEAVAPQYQRTMEFGIFGGVNFLELIDPVDPANRHPFTRVGSELILNGDHLTSHTTYYYYPDFFPVFARHTISTGLTYVLERSVHQKILSFDRSITLGYTYNQQNGSTSNISGRLNYSLSDYILPTGSISYGFAPSVLLGAGVGLTLQSPSRCWKMSATVDYRSGVPGLNFGFDLALNFSGTGFGGVNEIAAQVGAQGR